MENKMQMPEFNGWRDNRIDEQTPLLGIIQFLNVMNERLILIEDGIKINKDGQDITLTQYWIEVQKAEYQRWLEEMQKRQAEAQATQEQSANTEQAQ